MELSRIQKFVNEHVDASLPAESQTLILGSDMDLMGGDNTGCTNLGSCTSDNFGCTNGGACSGSNTGCMSTANSTRPTCN